MQNKWKGTLKQTNDNRDIPITLQAYKALDGCAILAFFDSSLDGEITKSFRHLTYNTYAGVYEEGVLTSSANPFKNYYGSKDGQVVSMQWSPQQGTGAGEKSEWTLEEGVLTWKLFLKNGKEWELIKEAIFHRI